MEVGRPSTVCPICLDSKPPLVDSGCGCPNPGFAHPLCRAAAKEDWWKCKSCSQPFTGQMEAGIVRARWDIAAALSEDNTTRLVATYELGLLQIREAKLADAEATLSGLLSIEKRVRGGDHPHTLGTKQTLAFCLSEQGKHFEATALAREVLSAQKMLHGDEHHDTIVAAGFLAECLLLEGRASYDS